MTLKQFLDAHPIIDKAALSIQMWPDIKSPKSKLYNKLSETASGTGKQRVTDKDFENAKAVLKKLAEDILKL